MNTSTFRYVGHRSIYNWFEWLSRWPPLFDQWWNVSVCWYLVTFSCVQVNVGRTSSGGIWREKFEEIISENAQLKVKLVTIETDIVRLLRQAQGSLSELSSSLEILNELELNSVSSVEPANRMIDTEFSQLFLDDF